MSPCIAFTLDIFFLLKLILISLYTDFYILKFLSHFHLYLISSCFYSLTFLCYLHLHLYNHLFRFRHWHFYITYTDTSFIMYLFSHIDTFIILTLIPYFIMYWVWHIDVFILLTLILISSCIEFYKLTFLYYLHLYLFHHVVCFSHLHFYITSTHNYFIMY